MSWQTASYSTHLPPARGNGTTRLAIAAAGATPESVDSSDSEIAVQGIRSTCGVHGRAARRACPSSSGSRESCQSRAT